MTAENIHLATQSSLSANISSNRLSEFSMGASAASSVALAKLISVLDELIVLANQLKQMETQTAWIVGQRESEATKKSIQDQANATEMQGIGQAAGGAISLGVMAKGTWDSNFSKNSFDKQIKAKQAEISDHEERLTALYNPEAANPSLGGKPNGAPIQPKEALTKFSNKEPMLDENQKEMGLKEKKDLASTMIDPKEKEAAIKAVQDNKQMLVREKEDLQSKQTQRLQTTSSLGQAIQSLTSGSLQAASAIYTNDQAAQEATKTLLQTASQLIQQAYQSLGSLSDTSSQLLLSELQSLQQGLGNVQG